MKRTKAITAIAGACLFAFSTGAFAQQTGQLDIPRTISYQGILTSNDGAPLADGLKNVTVTLYADPAGTIPLWQETQTTTITNGIFNLYLGTAQPLPSSSQMNRPLWVGTAVDGHQEMRPLTPLSASPYALNLPDRAVTTGKLADGAVTADKVEMDYVKGFRVNGQEISAKGAILNIEGSDDIALRYDEATGSLQIGQAQSRTHDPEKKGASVLAATDNLWSANGDIWDIVTGSRAVTSSDWLGSSTNAEVKFRTNNQVVMRYIPAGTIGAETPNIIGGYSGNTINSGSEGSVIGGGGANTFVNEIEASSEQSTISGGSSNVIGDGTNSAQHGTIAGGEKNKVYASWATVGGGRGNTASGDESTVSGGNFNLASGNFSTVAGGHHVKASGVSSFVGGGGVDENHLSAGQYSNVASGKWSSVVGGFYDSASGDHASVGGGRRNHAAGYGSSIGGGDSNLVFSTGGWSFIGSGQWNKTDASWSVIGGGKNNQIYNAGGSNFSVIGGGEDNSILSQYTYIGGGASHSATGYFGTIAGGYDHDLSAQWGTIGGGFRNSSSADYGIVGGGRENQIMDNAYRSAIVGGSWNTIEEDAANSFIGGGTSNRIDGSIITNPNQLNATIPGGDNLIAQSWAQTVIGGFNLPKGNVAGRYLGSLGPKPKDPILIVGNGTVNTGTEYRSNAFEVSYNGHSTVYHTNGTGAATPAIRGTSYTDNTVYAWAYAVPAAAIPIGGTVEVQCDFGVANIQYINTGHYLVTMNLEKPEDDGTFSPMQLDCGSVTASIVMEGPACAVINTSRITGNAFNVYISDFSCHAVDLPFTFKVTGRP